METLHAGIVALARHTGMMLRDLSDRITEVERRTVDSYPIVREKPLTSTLPGMMAGFQIFRTDGTLAVDVTYNYEASTNIQGASPSVIGITKKIFGPTGNVAGGVLVTEEYSMVHNASYAPGFGNNAGNQPSVSMNLISTTNTII